MSTFTITSTIKKYPKRLPYEVIKEKVLGKNYNLSLVFVGKKRAATINKQSRNKTYSPNVLSFPLTDTEGEIIICPDTAVAEAKKFNLTHNGYIAFLFIHGLLHLKGHDHGDTMDKLERKYLNAFNIK
ncbi:rRNA maturation RNase YbeY [Candidatus Nomurabacteria bacterium]|nr:rRNA maturation RNase YbeY [Candidatus Kaiserbacteria bacterium]MCB9810341.1 rRNA maturation RNase YbeY [Candidatus Nomurabacteria bacterium]MCB9818451.1 rRNA maturation RNase YbeY [Candidatus Nomurabacteria bacterium]